MSRNDDMQVLYEQGKTLAEIGAGYGLTRERVRQILRSRGVSRYDGGGHLKGQLAEAKRGAEADQRSADLFGMPRAEVKELRGRYPTYKESPFNKYREQRTTALDRGIEWRFTFAEWWDVWEQSGKYEKRGREVDQFVMGRCGDTGAYAKDNVKIITASINHIEYHQTKAARLDRSC